MIKICIHSLWHRYPIVFVVVFPFFLCILMFVVWLIQVSQLSQAIASLISYASI